MGMQQTIVKIFENSNDDENCLSIFLSDFPRPLTRDQPETNQALNPAIRVVCEKVRVRGREIHETIMIKQWLL